MKKKSVSIACLFTLLFAAATVQAQVISKPGTYLHNLQPAFVGLRFGMFIHFNIPMYMNQDWRGPQASPIIFNPIKLDCILTQLNPIVSNGAQQQNLPIEVTAALPPSTIAASVFKIQKQLIRT